MAHVTGSLMLVQLRSSANFETDFGRKLYLGSLLPNVRYPFKCRTRLLIFLKLVGAIGKRKALPLSKLPPADAFRGESASYVKLFQVLNTMPAILEQCDLVNSITSRKAPSPEVTPAISILVFMFREFESHLSNWNTQFAELHNNQELYWEVPSKLADRLPPDNPLRIFTTFYTFPSLDIALQLVFSWACLLLMHKALAYISESLAENGYSSISTYATDFDNAIIFHKMEALAMEILKSLEYFIHPDVGFAAIDFLGLPVNLVYAIMNARGYREVLWFDVIFARVREILPGMGECLESMAHEGGGGRAYRLLVLNQ